MPSITSFPVDRSNKMMLDVLPWIQSQRSISYGDGRGMIPINPQAIPPWWRSLSQHYESFNNSLENFLRSSEIERLVHAEILTIDFQNMTRAILNRIFGDVDDQSSVSGQSRWATSMSKSSSTSSPLHYHNRNISGYRHKHQNEHVTSSTSAESPYTSPVYSYSCPSTSGRMTYTQQTEGISLSLDALYFLIQAAQDLTDLSPIDIRAQRLDTLQLTPHSLRLVDLPNQLCTTIYAVIRRLLFWDHGLIREMMESRLIMFQLEELVKSVDEDGERPYWRLRECVEELRRIREWRKAKIRSIWGKIWAWIVL